MCIYIYIYIYSVCVCVSLSLSIYIYIERERFALREVRLQLVPRQGAGAALVVPRKGSNNYK